MHIFILLLLIFLTSSAMAMGDRRSIPPSPSTNHQESGIPPQIALPLPLFGDLKSCEIVIPSSKKEPPLYKKFDGQLSKYWAQRRIGSDLLKDMLRDEPPVQKNLVAVFDVASEKHDEGVKNLISDHGKHAVLPDIGDRLTMFSRNRSTISYIQRSSALLIKKAQKKCRSQKADKEKCIAQVMPSFANVSLGWTSEVMYDSFKKISPPTVIIMASGNDYPTPMWDRTARGSKDFNAIAVGSLSTRGRRSVFSSEGEEVHIMAPSDYYLASADNNGNYLAFGGTSGSAPLVTGSLAGFEWLAGYHPTAEESKILLANTAIPTLYSNDRPRRNGVGMVNAYKLGQVGQKLKKTCGTNAQCFKELIRQKDTYQFPEDSGLTEKFNQTFPKCSETCGIKNTSSSCGYNNIDWKTGSACANHSDEASCADKSHVFKRLRKAAFLNPRNKELWRKIACVYAGSGFMTDAVGVLSHYQALSSIPDGFKVCQTDSDCVLVPSSCGGTPAEHIIFSSQGNVSKSMTKGGTGFNGLQYKSPPLKPLTYMNTAEAEVFYNECFQKQPNKALLCNGKCRCGNNEEIVDSPNGNNSKMHYKSFCQQSRCVMKYKPFDDPTPFIIPESSSSHPDTEYKGSHSVQ